MPVSDKHGESTTQVFYSAFDGGLNLSTPPESLNRNELTQAMNVEFSAATGSLRVRGGFVWSGKFASEVEDAADLVGNRGFLAKLKDGRLQYFSWNCTWDITGTLSGDDKMCVCPWDDEQYLVASGGKLQVLRTLKSSSTGLPELVTLEESPDNCRVVFVREGRAGVNDGADTLRFSWIGDCEKWTTAADESTDDEAIDDDSMGQFVEIGYKDGMDIVAVVPLGQDLIVFKTPGVESDRGTIYRLTGNFPDWQVLEAAHNTGTFSQQSVQAVGNDVYYLNKSGLATLSSVASYGEIKTAWPDRKIANELSQDLNMYSQLWNVPDKQQLWVLPLDTQPILWVFDYSRGIWTQFTFPEMPVFSRGVNGRAYVIFKNSVYHMNDWFMYDEIDDGVLLKITAKVRLGALLRGLQTLIKAAFVSFNIMPDGEAYLKLLKFKLPLKLTAQPVYIYGNTNIAYGYDLPLVSSSSVLSARQRCIVRDWSITPEFEITGGGCSLNTTGLNIVEV